MTDDSKVSELIKKTRARVDKAPSSTHEREQSADRRLTRYVEEIYDELTDGITSEFTPETAAKNFMKSHDNPKTNKKMKF